MESGESDAGQPAINVETLHVPSARDIEIHERNGRYSVSLVLLSGRVASSHYYG